MLLQLLICSFDRLLQCHEFIGTESRWCFILQTWVNATHRLRPLVVTGNIFAKAKKGNDSDELQQCRNWTLNLFRTYWGLQYDDYKKVQYWVTAKISLASQVNLQWTKAKFILVDMAFELNQQRNNISWKKWHYVIAYKYKWELAKQTANVMLFYYSSSGKNISLSSNQILSKKYKWALTSQRLIQTR